MPMNTKAVNWGSQRLAFMMNESKTIRELPRSVHFPIAVWSQGVFVGQPPVKHAETSRISSLSSGLVPFMVSR